MMIKYYPDSFFVACFSIDKSNGDLNTCATGHFSQDIIEKLRDGDIVEIGSKRFVIESYQIYANNFVAIVHVKSVTEEPKPKTALIFSI